MELASIDTKSFPVQKHQRYFERHLLILPSKYQDNEPNKLAIVAYSLIGLSILGVDTSKKYQNSKSWLLKHQRSILSGELSVSGFIPSLSIDIEECPSLSLMSTLFGLWGLICLEENGSNAFEGLDLEGIRRFVSKCQCKNGSFVSSFDTLAFNEISRSSIDPTDLRYAYAAVTILYLLGCRNSEDFDCYISVEDLLTFIKGQMCGSGFGQYGEAHAGLTSCALSILDLLDDQWSILPSQFLEQTIEWLLHRQVSSQGSMTLMTDSNECYDIDDHGGFQGRENKFADTCYCFWCLNSLSILQKQTKSKLDCSDALVDYLLETTQSKLLGGFAKNSESDPDLYHSCLGLAALAMNSEEFNGTLFLPDSLSRRIKVKE
ncbi:LAFA_0E20164g1_1 [Lachancea sp. 'fantastica']|nr:LAFA_0E20164g1_1 [Lachancea sp. 'fantastica']